MLHLFADKNDCCLIAVGGTVEESPAQAEARSRADMKIKMESYLKIWKWVIETLGMDIN